MFACKAHTQKCPCIPSNKTVWLLNQCVGLLSVWDLKGLGGSPKTRGTAASTSTKPNSPGTQVMDPRNQCTQLPATRKANMGACGEQSWETHQVK